jgi:CheY-like chemotaxis protein
VTDRGVSRVSYPDPAERAQTLLIVEDEELIRVALADYFQDCGFKVLETATADAAVEILEKSGLVVDLVVSDVRTPGAIDGFELAQWIREHQKGLPVILTSGDAMKSKLAKDLCKEEAFLQKPFRQDALLTQVRLLIGSDKKAR